MSAVKDALRAFMRRWDHDVFQVSALPLTAYILSKQRLLSELNIDVVLDVGANEGQYGSFLRKRLGYHGRIVSFEPLHSAFSKLALAAAEDKLWQTVHTALGERVGTDTIHIAGNSQSSSLLPMQAQHLRSAPKSAYVGTEVISVTTLDALSPSLGLANQNVYLKVDTQGYELAVLNGAEHTLKEIGTLELEMSFVQLYEGQALFGELHAWLRSLGYVMISIEPAFRDEATQEILQADIIFKRTRKTS